MISQLQNARIRILIWFCQILNLHFFHFSISPLLASNAEFFPYPVSFHIFLGFIISELNSVDHIYQETCCYSTQIHCVFEVCLFCGGSRHFHLKKTYHETFYLLLLAVISFANCLCCLLVSL